MFDVSDNRTSWSAGVYPALGKGGRSRTVVVKASFAFDERGELTPVERPPIEPADRCVGEPGASSLAAACETVPFKAGGEIVLTGTAHPPRPDATVMEVEVALERPDGTGWRKALRVFGPRRWERHLFGLVPGPATQLAPLPLVYENAFGGGDDEERRDLRNPVGKGYSPRGRLPAGSELPQIEIGPGFITSPGSRPEPAGFGPVPSHWAPRVQMFQKLGPEIEGKNLPPDLFNAAPPDQRFSRPFEGGEIVTLWGLVPGAPPEGVRIRIPRLRPGLTLVTGMIERIRVTGENRKSLGPVCDTLVVDGDGRRISLLWRVALELSPEEEKTARVILQELAPA